MDFHKKSRIFMNNFKRLPVAAARRPTSELVLFLIVFLILILILPKPPLSGIRSACARRLLCQPACTSTANYMTAAGKRSAEAKRAGGSGGIELSARGKGAATQPQARGGQAPMDAEKVRSRAAREVPCRASQALHKNEEYLSGFGHLFLISDRKKVPKAT